MARIPDCEIERLKLEVSLQRLAEASGIELKRHGADLLGLCPFHEDREPSLVISPNLKLKRSWRVTTSASMRCTSVTAVTLRDPSSRRSR